MPILGEAGEIFAALDRFEPICRDILHRKEAVSM